MKKLLITLAIALYPVVGASQYVVPSINKAVPYFSPEPQFNENEKRSLNVNAELLEKDLPTLQSENGGVEFIYGQGMRTVICSPLRLCDIGLQRGEIVQDVMVGDTRWKVQPSVSGSHPNHQVHAIVKPSDVGLVTSLMISTDRRVYNLTLKSSADNYMPRVTFTYPGSDTSTAWTSFMEQQQAQIQNDLMIKTAAANAAAEAAEAKRMEAEKQIKTPRLGVDIDSLDFNYTIRGDAAWRPTRVFDDGIHTYVDLPNRALSDDIPVLLVSPVRGSNEIVNYRLKNNRFVIDGLTSKVVLLRDVGNRQQRIEVTKNR